MMRVRDQTRRSKKFLKLKIQAVYHNKYPMKNLNKKNWQVLSLNKKKSPKKSLNLILYPSLK